MNRIAKTRKFNTVAARVAAVILGLSCVLTVCGCAPEYREFFDDGVETKAGFNGEDVTGSLASAPVGTWRAELPFYRLGFTQISDLRVGNFANAVDEISVDVPVELVFGDDGTFFCLADRDAVISACTEFGAGFLEILNEADVETLAQMKNMSVGDFETVLAKYGKTKEDFAVEVSESLMKFIDRKTSAFSEYESFGEDGMCIVYGGVYAVRGGRLYVGNTAASVFDKGSIIAELNGTTLYISSDTDLRFFDDCSFSLVTEQ